MKLLLQVWRINVTHTHVWKVPWADSRCLGAMISLTECLNARSQLLREIKIDRGHIHIYKYCKMNIDYFSSIIFTSDTTHPICLYYRIQIQICMVGIHGHELISYTSWVDQLLYQLALSRSVDSAAVVARRHHLHRLPACLLPTDFFTATATWLCCCCWASWSSPPSFSSTTY